MTAAQLTFVPLERNGQPEDVAAVVCFLLSDAGVYVSGAEIPIAGGFGISGGAKYLSDAFARGRTDAGQGRPSQFAGGWMR